MDLKSLMQPWFTRRRLSQAQFSESFAVKVIQNFLFHLARRQHVSPRFFFALAREKLQVMPDLEQHRFGLTLDFFEQYFLCAHIGNVSRWHTVGESGALRLAQSGAP
jgi:hypothetical protein